MTINIDRRIAIAGLVIAIITLVATIFLPEVRGWFEQLTGIGGLPAEARAKVDEWMRSEGVSSYTITSQKAPITNVGILDNYDEAWCVKVSPAPRYPSTGMFRLFRQGLLWTAVMASPGVLQMAGCSL